MNTTKTKPASAVLLTVAVLGGLASPMLPLPAASGSAADNAPSKNSKKEDKANAEIEKLRGTWRVVSLEVEGRKMADNVFKGSKIVLKGSDFTTISPGATYKGTFSVDPSAAPKTIEMNFTEGPEAGNKSLGIYELDGDTWKLCLTIGAKDRPGTFATKTGSGLALETLKREAGGAPDGKK
jgi:uncharacterized protein (TIGR03067 family)